MASFPDVCIQTLECPYYYSFLPSSKLIFTNHHNSAATSFSNIEKIKTRFQKLQYVRIQVGLATSFFNLKAIRFQSWGCDIQCVVNSQTLKVEPPSTANGVISNFKLVDSFDGIIVYLYGDYSLAFTQILVFQLVDSFNGVVVCLYAVHRERITSRIWFLNIFHLDFLLLKFLSDFLPLSQMLHEAKKKKSDAASGIYYYNLVWYFILLLIG